MKSIVYALFMLTQAAGFALGIALSPVSKDPMVLLEYATLSAVMVVTAGVFWVVFRRYNLGEERANETDSEDS